jgi:hypothetical protein
MPKAGLCNSQPAGPSSLDLCQGSPPDSLSLKCWLCVTLFACLQPHLHHHPPGPHCRVPSHPSQAASCWWLLRNKTFESSKQRGESSAPPRGWASGAHQVHRVGFPARCWGSHAQSPIRSWMAHSCPAKTLRMQRVGRPQGLGDRGVGGHTYDPHAIKGHLGVELGHHVLPPVEGLRVGEVGEGSGSGPHLDKRPGGN